MRLDRWIDDLIFRIYGNVTPEAQACIYVFGAIFIGLLIHWGLK